MKYTVETMFNKEMIKQSTILEDGEGAVSSIANNIIHLQEAGVREALINLGWTPPKEEGK